MVDEMEAPLRWKAGGGQCAELHSSLWRERNGHVASLRLVDSTAAWFEASPSPPENIRCMRNVFYCQVENIPHTSCLCLCLCLVFVLVSKSNHYVSVCLAGWVGCS